MWDHMTFHLIASTGREPLKDNVRRPMGASARGACDLLHSDLQVLG